MYLKHCTQHSWINNTAHNNTAIFKRQYPIDFMLERRILIFLKLFDNSPKCHFVTYYSHFRVLGNLAKIFGLNRGKTPKKNANFDF